MLNFVLMPSAFCRGVPPNMHSTISRTCGAAAAGHWARDGFRTRIAKHRGKKSRSHQEHLVYDATVDRVVAWTSLGPVARSMVSVNQRLIP